MGTSSWQGCPLLMKKVVLVDLMDQLRPMLMLVLMISHQILSMSKNLSGLTIASPPLSLSEEMKKSTVVHGAHI